MKEQLKRTAQALEADAATPATADADGGGGGAQQQKGLAGRAQQRAKKADDYHARHAQWVAEFNELTGGECAGGEGGVKWAAVRTWQQKHWQANNLLADGLIGPKTIEAAKIVAKKNGAKDEKKDGKDGGESAAKDQQQEAPQPGQAEGAEASIEKPKLDDDSDEEHAPTAADGENKGPAKGGDGKKAPTLVEFEQVVATLEAALAAFKQPQGGGPQKPIAEHYVDGTDDKEAKPAIGAMMAPKVLGDYKKAAKTLHDRWDGLDAEGRANALLEAVNTAIAAEQVPPIHRVNLIGMPNPGEFEAGSWTMNISKPLFSKLRSPGMEQVDDIASKVFHEGRHAEQRFSMARLIASKDPKLSAEEVAKQSGVERKVAVQAIELSATPLPAKQAEAAETFQHATRDNPEEHQAIETASAQITDAANQVAALFRAMSPGDQAIASARWHDLRQRTIVALEAYYHLATERDAYAAQKQLKNAATSN